MCSIQCFHSITLSTIGFGDMVLSAFIEEMSDEDENQKPSPFNKKCVLFLGHLNVSFKWGLWVEWGPSRIRSDSFLAFEQEMV